MLTGMSAAFAVGGNTSGCEVNGAGVASAAAKLRVAAAATIAVIASANPSRNLTQGTFGYGSAYTSTTPMPVAPPTPRTIAV